MEPDNKPALAPDKLIRTSCRPPKNFRIDLDAEGLSAATRADILSPAFFQEAHGKIQQGDVIELTSSIGENLELIVGPESADGFHVSVLTDHGKSVATFTPAEGAAA